MYTPSVEEAKKYIGEYNYIPVKKEILSDIITPIRLLRKLKNYSKILYADARLISGLGIENAAEFGALVCDLMLND